MTEKPEVLILSAKLVSGNFESSVRVPLDATQAAKDRAIVQWLQMIQFALKAGVSEMSATLSPDELHHDRAEGSDGKADLANSRRLRARKP